MAGVRDNTVSNVVSGSIASFKSVGQIPLKSLKVNFNPIQEGDGDPSPSNIRAISGWTGLNVFRSESKNILDPFNNPIWNHNVYSVNQSGEITVTGSDGRGWIDTQISPLNLVKGTYTISYTGGGNCNLRTSIDDYETNYNTTNGHLTFTLTEDAGVKFKFSGKTYPATFYVQIEPGQTTHDYESYKPFATIPVSWSDLGTVYGGYVDLISGEVWQGWRKHVLSSNMNQWSTWGTKLVYNSSIMNNTNGKRQAGSQVYCDTLLSVGNLNPQQVTSMQEIRYYGTDVRYPEYLFMAKPEEMSITDWKTWFVETYPNATICYKLAEPVLIGTIDPITIKSLIGTNNIWSNADTVEAQYCALESLDIYKQRFKTNEPYLQSASGSVISFNTDMVAPLKECKVYFQPVQASGTPSPDNVLPINGWTNINIFHSQKNIFDFPVTDFNPNYTVNGWTGWGQLFDIPLSWRGQTFTYSAILTIKSTSSRDFVNVRVWEYNDSGQPTLTEGIKIYRKNTDVTDVSYVSFTMKNDTVQLGLGLYIGADDRVQNPILELGSTAIEYEPYNGSTTSITLPSTYYGGWVDLTAGKFIQTYKYIHLVGNENWLMSTSTLSDAPFRPSIPVESKSTGVYKPGISDKLAPTTDWQPHLYNCVINIMGRLLIGLPAEMDTKEKVNNWIQSLGGIDVCWETAFPNEYTLTPEQIKTLKNQNNVWSNTNGITQVKYWTHIPKGGTLPWHPIKKFSKAGLIQVSASGHTLYENAYTTLNSTLFNFLSMGAQSGGNYYPAIGISGREEFFDIFPYPIPRGAKTITVNCGSNFAPIIVYYDKNTKANVANLARDCAKVLDGETPAGNTDWSISAWQYGDKTFTIPTGLGINAFTLGFNCKTSDIYNNFDINNPGISISFGYN